MKDINKMNDEELFKFLDDEAVRIREERFIRPTPLRRNKLYAIATEEMNKKCSFDVSGLPEPVVKKLKKILNNKNYK
jgi:hypothetical protein